VCVVKLAYRDVGNETRSARRETDTCMGKASVSARFALNLETDYESR
jgi:hypothetical protein